MARLPQIARKASKRAKYIGIRGASVGLGLIFRRRPRVLLYTDSRGLNLSANSTHVHYPVMLGLKYNIEPYVCPEKWTSLIDFIELLQNRDLAAYDAVVAHVGVVDFSPRHRSTAVNKIYSAKKAGYDRIFGEQNMRSHFETCYDVKYEGEDTVSMFSVQMMIDSLIPLLRGLPKFTYIGGNRLVDGWVGDYWKPRPLNINIVVDYFRVLSKSLSSCLDLLCWSDDEIKRFTTDGIHPSRAGSEIILARLTEIIEGR